MRLPPPSPRAGKKKNKEDLDLLSGPASDASDAPEKVKFLIEKMSQFSPECSLKFVKRPIRLNLKFEKSFTMAIKKNKTEVLELFPRYSVKSVYVPEH